MRYDEGGKRSVADNMSKNTPCAWLDLICNHITSHGHMTDEEQAATFNIWLCLNHSETICAASQQSIDANVAKKKKTWRLGIMQ